MRTWTKRLRILCLGILLGGCIPQGLSIVVVPPPPLPPEPPVPFPFEADAPPERIATQTAGLEAASSLDPTLYYSVRRERWYRWAFNRWYEAFSWDGNWFPLEDPPEELEPYTPRAREQIR